MSRFMELGGNGAMQSFLSSAPNLTDLSLSMDCGTARGVLDLENLVGTYTWKSLSSVRFRGMGFLDEQLIDLISRHQSSLRLIEMISIGLTTIDEYGKTPIAQRFTLTSWEELLSSMECFDLDHLLIKSIWDSDFSAEEARTRRLMPRSWFSDNRDSIRAFLLSGRTAILPSLTTGFQLPT